MQINKIVILALLLLGFTKIEAQEKKLLTLKEAVEIAVTNSDAATLAKTKVETSKLELDNTKNNRYPSVKASGQYMRLSSAHVDSHIQSNNDPADPPAAPLKVDQLVLGQVNVNMPIFNGFKLKNSIAESESIYKAETFSEKHSKEEIGLEVVNLFSSLFKAQQMVDLIQENLKTAEQRVKDFTAMEENGLIARHDLLKSQLQQSNVELSLDNAKKNAAIANYKLITLLKLPESTQVEIDIEAVKRDMASNMGTTGEGERNDLKSLELKNKLPKAELKSRKETTTLHWL